MSEPGFMVVIPARYASSRLPAKPLLEITGKPMIQWVWEQACASGAEAVVVATDDSRIAERVAAFGGEVQLTASHHPSGTDRIAEVAALRGWSPETIVVNLQGDEPTMPPALIHQVAEDMANHPEAAITTLSAAITQRAQLFDPHLVKVVTNQQGYALYFSRAPIPWHRDAFTSATQPLPEGGGWARHIGLYAYRAAFLARFVQLPPAPLEVAESLEQLRALWNGAAIHVSQASVAPGHGVDTMEDLERVRNAFSRGSAESAEE